MCVLKRIFVNDRDDKVQFILVDCDKFETKLISKYLKISIDVMEERGGNRN